ncbi:hypothetical protein FZ983_27220 [Azospirillum sp. B21]|uniref:S26 family signal peptidase n=1 Tax=Azospirillum sp. B21 TaxID=2607496 RepID=UPI0011EDABE2|nr:S26 family signal peptidase [Azospirillum sp. B21]KAA0574595.1 hypothetical protein FZ983_27220 [Azospirillum sp. B21]
MSRAWRFWLKPPGSRREPWKRFVPKAVMAAAMVTLPFIYVQDRFMIGINPQISSCLNVRVLLVDRYDRTLERGAVFAYLAKGLEPAFADGTLMGKVLDGLPGDRYSVSAEGVDVNGVHVVDGLPLAARLKRDPEAFFRTGTIPAGRILMLGRTEESFDGRYFGLIDAGQIVGRAYPIL